MAFILAKYWGVMPHVMWRYPFRYYRELRDAYIESMKPPEEDDTSSFDWEDDAVDGGPI